MVLRHAQTEAFRPGAHDRDRRLTPDGQTQAAELGDHLAAEGVTVDLALCSAAMRAQQTLQALDLGCPVDVTDRIYNVGAETILDEVRQTPDDVTTLLVIGHAPGLPMLAHALADRETSDPQALAILDASYPAGTLSALHFDDDWAKLRTAALAYLRLP